MSKFMVKYDYHEEFNTIRSKNNNFALALNFTYED